MAGTLLCNSTFRPFYIATLSVATAVQRQFNMRMQHCGMTLTARNRSTRKKTSLSVTLFTTNPTRTDLGSNPAIRGMSPATIRRPPSSTHTVDAFPSTTCNIARWDRPTDDARSHRRRDTDRQTNSNQYTQYGGDPYRANLATGGDMGQHSRLISCGTAKGENKVGRGNNLCGEGPRQGCPHYMLSKPI
jgi:hypothetical protein